MTQLMLDSWLFVGCWYNELNVYVSRSSTQRSNVSAATKTGTCSPYGERTSNDALVPDEDDNDAK